jgi:hypothetical protein
MFVEASSGNNRLGVTGMNGIVKKLFGFEYAVVSPLIYALTLQ